MKDEHMTFPNRNVTELSNQENLHMILYIYIPTQTFIHDCWKNHSFEQMDLCWQSNVSAF